MTHTPPSDSAASPAASVPAGPISAGSVSAGSVSADVLFDSLCAAAAAEMAQARVPGLALGLLYQGQRYTAGLGVTSVEHPLLVTPDTLFQIGSITKTFVGLMVMRLVEQGVLDLDAPLRSYLPAFRMADEDAAARATIRHLLTHTGNWAGDLFLDTGEGEDALSRYVAALAQAPQRAPLGSVFSYNNASFTLLGHLLETVCAKPFEQLLAELALEPLGMEHAYLEPADVMTRRFAVGHNAGSEAGDDGIAVARPWRLPRAVRPAGGIVTSAPELLKYAAFYLDGGVSGSGERLLSPASLAEMHRVQTPIWGDSEAIGLTWFIDSRDGVRSLSHGGGTVGQCSLLALVPECGFALAVMTNGDNGWNMARNLYRWCVRHILGATPYVPQPTGAPAEALAQYAGHYERYFADADLEMQEGELRLRLTFKKSFPDEQSPVPPPTPWVRLDLAEPDRLLVLDGPLKDALIDVLRGPDGAIRWLRSGRVYTATPAAPAPTSES